MSEMRMAAHHCVSHPCPLCYPNWPQEVYQTTPTPPTGCICPPTSENTCESLMCPRKNWFRASAVSNGNH